MFIEKQKVVIVEGKDIETEQMLHNFLKDKLGFPSYYGMNLDALWDCITGHIALPIKIVWKDIEESKKKLGSQLVDDIIVLLEDAKKELGGNFDYEIQE